MGLRRSRKIIQELERYSGMDLQSWANYWGKGSDSYKTDKLSIEELRYELEIVSRLVFALVNDATDNEEEDDQFGGPTIGCGLDSYKVDGKVRFLVGLIMFGCFFQIRRKCYE